MESQSQSEAVSGLSSDQPSQHLDDAILSTDAYHLAHTIFPRLIEYLGSTISFPFVSIQDGFQLLSVDRAVWSKTADRLTSVSFVTDAEELVERSALAFVSALKDPEHGEALLQLPQCSRSLDFTSVTPIKPPQQPKLAEFYNAAGADAVVHLTVKDTAADIIESSIEAQLLHVFIASLISPAVNITEMFSTSKRVLHHGGFLVVTGDLEEWKSADIAMDLLRDGAKEIGFTICGGIEEGSALMKLDNDEGNIFQAVHGTCNLAREDGARWFGVIFKKPKSPKKA